MSADRGRPILAIAARALLLLPVFLLAWHFASPALSAIAGRGAVVPVAWATGGGVAMKRSGAALAYEITLQAPYRPGGTPSVVAEPEVVAGQYTFGLALFLALVAASWRHVRPRWGIAAAAALLAVLPAWGIAFDVLKQLGGAAQLQPFLRWGGGAREAIALGYQVGALLLPALAPVAAWLVLVRALWAPEPSVTASPANRS